MKSPSNPLHRAMARNHPKALSDIEAFHARCVFEPMLDQVFGVFTIVAGGVPCAIVRVPTSWMRIMLLRAGMTPEQLCDEIGMDMGGSGMIVARGIDQATGVEWLHFSVGFARRVFGLIAAGRVTLKCVAAPGERDDQTKRLRAGDVPGAGGVL